MVFLKIQFFGKKMGEIVDIVVIGPIVIYGLTRPYLARVNFYRGRDFPEFFHGVFYESLEIPLRSAPRLLSFRETGSIKCLAY